MSGVGGSGEQGAATYREVHPPWGLLVGAAVAKAVGAALVPFTSLVAHGVGYGLCSWVTIGLVLSFWQLDERRQKQDGVRYLQLRRWPSYQLRQAAAVVLTVGIVLAGVHAWFIANEWAVVR